MPLVLVDKKDSIRFWLETTIKVSPKDINIPSTAPSRQVFVYQVGSSVKKVAISFFKLS